MPRTPVSSRKTVTEKIPTTPEGTPFEVAPGIVITVREPTKEQVALLLKTVNAARRDGTLYIHAIDVFFRVITKLLINPEKDIPLLDDALLDGSVTLEQLAQIITQEESDGTQTTAASPKPRTRARA